MMDDSKDKKNLRRGFSTGANAAAAAVLALRGFIKGVNYLLQEENGLSVAIDLPHNKNIVFAAESLTLEKNHIVARFKKDAGDDPDITHGIIVSAELIPLKNSAKNFLTITGGDGVGQVTRLGLPIKVGEAAITPSPLHYIADNFHKEWQQHHDKKNPSGFQLKIHLANGEELAKKTLNPRLGIVGGLSVLGTSGIVIPYSCAAWIDTIHRGVDVAIAYHQAVIGAATGRVSEEVLQKKYHLPDFAMIDMGDFYFAMMKYLQKIKYGGRVMIAGGAGKLLKLAQGAGDLHNQRSRADMAGLARWWRHHGGDDAIAQKIILSSSTAEIMAAIPDDDRAILANIILHHCLATTKKNFPTLACQFMMVDRTGNILAEM